MALPSTTVADFSGKYVLNKQLSDESKFDDILAAQGVGLLKRKAVGMVSATSDVHVYADEGGVEHLDITAHVSGGFTSKAERLEGRVLNWTDKEIEHPLFGACTTKSKRVLPAEVDAAELQNGWTPECTAAGVIFIQVVPTSGTDWVSKQVWGIEEINGEKRHTRRFLVTTKKNKTVYARLVYDYAGPL
ncbi:hypothetical protein HMN09_01397000 [Mycena chlorophos]|uniref:Uncharacterized protein n=1 Tax=Mycena chlorophos TaxID=658473 RepID=A0A8H6RXE2_MYCCL|nr:hypothetical protein HMN09_01397000 [Mycena chlorophos]